MYKILRQTEFSCLIGSFPFYFEKFALAANQASEFVFPQERISDAEIFPISMSRRALQRDLQKTTRIRSLE